MYWLLLLLLLLIFRKFWVCKGGKMVAQTSLFFVLKTRQYFVKFLTADFHQNWQRTGRKFWKRCIYGSFAPKKPQNIRWSNRNLTLTSIQSRGHTTEILFTPRYSPRAREFHNSFFAQNLSFGALNCPNFCLFFHTKCLKHTFLLHNRMLPTIQCCNELPKGFFCHVWWESWGPQNFQIFTYGKCWYI